MPLFRRGVIYPLGENSQTKQFDKTESSDLVDNLSGIAYTNCQEEVATSDGALDRNTAQLSIRTAMHSGSEHRNTGRVFSCPSNATSKYF